jgi:predicted 3-demethylubiquinone-9 3-methyltransferase (glyoxalase superfamily)
MQKIVPNLWFDNQAEEAANFYASVFKNSKIGRTSYYDKASAAVSGQLEGSVLTVEFEIEGQQFIALNGGPAFTFSEAVSFMITCETQEEVDELWNKLSAHPESEQCGWLKDKFGVSWQVTPQILDDMLQDPDKQKAARVMEAMLEMKKIDISELQKAYDGK